MAGVLYHPYFEPSLSWLRASLLVYDHVWSIVPAEATYVPSQQIKRHLDVLPETFAPLVPEPLDIVHEYFVLRQLGRAFRSIAERNNSALPTTRFRYSETASSWDDGGLEITGVTKLHDAKVAYTVYEMLEEAGLVYGRTDDGFLLVDAEAANLVVSLLAQRMSTRLPMRTITDVESSFFLSTACNVIECGDPVDSRGVLAASVLNFHIPDSIGELSDRQYVEIRKRYEEIRETFPLYLRDLGDLMRVDDIRNVPELVARIKALLRTLNREMNRIKRSRITDSIKRWVPIGVGAAITLGSAFLPDKPSLKYVTGGATVAVQILTQALSQSPIPGRLQGAQSILLDTRQDIIDAQHLASWLDPNTILV